MPSLRRDWPCLPGAAARPGLCASYCEGRGPCGPGVGDSRIPRGWARTAAGGAGVSGVGRAWQRQLDCPGPGVPLARTWALRPGLTRRSRVPGERAVLHFLLVARLRCSKWGHKPARGGGARFPCPAPAPLFLSALRAGGPCPSLSVDPGPLRVPRILLTPAALGHGALLGAVPGTLQVCFHRWTSGT